MWGKEGEWGQPFLSRSFQVSRVDPINLLYKTHKLHYTIQQDHTFFGQEVFKFQGQTQFRKMHLLIDGYNIINKWPELKKATDIGLEFARDKLIWVMSEYAALTGEKVTIVFDGSCKRTSYPNTGEGVDVVFSQKGESADAVIERLVIGSENPGLLLVATGDIQEGLFILGKGARHISPDELKQKVISVFSKTQKDFGVNIEIT